MKTDQEISDLIEARKAELQSLMAEHEKDRHDFVQRSTQRQLKVTHLEGCITQLLALIPEPEEKK